MTKAKKAPKATAPKKLTASQRIEALEGQYMASIQNNQILAGEIDNLRQTLTAVARRLNATISAGEKGDLSNDSVNDFLMEENTKELVDKVIYLVEQGVLEKSDEEIGEKSFIVARELDAESNVVNPRIQFALASVLDEVKAHILGKKAGDVIDSQEEGGLLLEITEVFNIVERVEKNLEEGSESA
jgi:hypothetical protein